MVEDAVGIRLPEALGTIHQERVGVDGSGRKLLDELLDVAGDVVRQPWVPRLDARPNQVGDGARQTRRGTIRVVARGEGRTRRRRSLLREGRHEGGVCLHPRETAINLLALLVSRSLAQVGIVPGVADTGASEALAEHRCG
eukprot:7382976-Prymnesium_polylepis.2